QLPDSLYKNIQWFQVAVNTKINPSKVFLNLLFSKLPYNAERFISSEFKKNLEKVLQEHQFDIVQLEGLYLTPYIASIKAFSKATIALRAHNVEHEIWDRMRQNTSNWFKKYYYLLLAKRVKEMELKALQKVDLLIPITKKDVESLPFKKHENIWVCPGGMPDNHFQMSKPTKPQTICFLGALDWVPNQEGLSWFIEKVWIPVHKKFPQWSFEIAGRNCPKAFVNHLANYPVTFIGEVPNANDFIDRFPVVVVPLLSGSGMRIKIVEALSRGKCVVTTTIGVEGITAQNEKELFIYDQPIEIVQLLENLFSNPQIIEDCGQNAFKFASENYKNSRLIGDLRAFYHQKLQKFHELS
ncbi:MAG: glycosyltransferase family 4 protein, partial [Salinivirgaceae bacterium]|nr:glycosyltransferase family 4 protein [Salinivirgaceae bacterium]